MIRLPSSAIVLGRSDLREFERRRQRYHEVEALNQEFSRFAVAAPDGPPFTHSQNQYNRDVAAEGELQSLQAGDGLVADSQAQPLAVHKPVRITSQLEHDEYGRPPSHISSSNTVDETPRAIDLDDEHGYVTIGSENPAREFQRMPTPSKNDFYYGGFVERPTEDYSDEAANLSLSLRMLRFGRNDRFLICW